MLSVSSFSLLLRLVSCRLPIVLLQPHITECTEQGTKSFTVLPPPTTPWPALPAVSCVSTAFSTLQATLTHSALLLLCLAPSPPCIPDVPSWKPSSSPISSHPLRVCIGVTSVSFGGRPCTSLTTTLLTSLVELV